MEWLSIIATAAGNISCIIALLVIFIKPFRRRMLVDKEARAGQQCLLRAEIVRIYYKNLEEKKLRQYEYENLCRCYTAYKALGGNSFVDHVYEEVQEWLVIS